MDLRKLAETPPWEWPEEADKVLIEFLTKDQVDASERLLAADLAGDYTVINDELVDALLSILQGHDESEQLRGKAAISLGPVLEQADIFGFDDPDDVPISERSFRKIQESLHRLYLDAALPKKVRRRILEASVRAPRDWHQDAIRSNYAGDDEEWRLTAVFCMRWVRGFDKQILEALESNNEDIHYQAVRAAGNWEMDAAWPHISGLVSAPGTDKPLLLAAVDAMATIRPQEASATLLELAGSDDEEIVDAAHEAMALAAALSDDAFDDV
ncbi:MAG: hypothetical protein PVG41_07260 [Desulfobacteraceae bacterium]|jgi:hypothetical protein